MWLDHHTPITMFPYAEHPRWMYSVFRDIILKESMFLHDTIQTRSSDFSFRFDGSDFFLSTSYFVSFFPSPFGLHLYFMPRLVLGQTLAESHRILGDPTLGSLQYVAEHPNFRQSTYF
jgi:hypothetical protein